MASFVQTVNPHLISVSWSRRVMFLFEVVFTMWFWVDVIFIVIEIWEPMIRVFFYFLPFLKGILVRIILEIVNLPQTLGVWNVQLPIFSKRSKTLTHSEIFEIMKISCFPWNAAYSFYLHIDASKRSIHDIKHYWCNSLRWNAYEGHESCLAHDRVWLQRKVQNFDQFHE